ncbi:DUF2316 family protein [Enterococcus raffinosus]|uniref:DUF2316 family protein n=1 Tax=Enterococcus raffinosus TaxID=71452 RepID=UPI001C111C2B|nr:DUF2316 family protein [Enterococcus raffinosus]MBU5360172.1 DUF2316 family protein [Enterococcus raffinosus]
MSLTPQQVHNTKKELQENFERTGLAIDQIAADLQTTTDVIKDTLALEVNQIEDPWVLKNYLEDMLEQQGIASVPFTALVGDYHRYWFLNSRRIDKKKIG